MKDYISKIKEYRDREIDVLNSLDIKSVNDVINVLEDARTAGKRVFICGNGGSGATASHYAGDFNKGVNMGIVGVDGYAQCAGRVSAGSADGAGAGNTDDSYDMSVAGRLDEARESGMMLYNFECLNDNSPTLLAVANDESYAEVFRYPLSVKMRPGDVVIGISGSGNSQNVINALDYANARGGVTVAIVGYDGGKMKRIADHCIHVDIDDMQIAEDVHMFLDHLMMWVIVHGE